MVCGLPGSGKTTLARRLAHELPGVRLCPDEWLETLGASLWDAALRERVEALQWSLAQELLGHGCSAVIEWGTWAQEERDGLLRGGRRLGARVELHMCDAPDAVLLRRVLERGREDPPMTAADIASARGAFQAPDDAELGRYDLGARHETPVHHKGP